MIDNELDAGVEIQKVRDVIGVYQKNDFGKLLKPYKNQATLVIGISGTGKSTLCQLLAGSVDLRSKSEPDSYDFFITDDDNNISDSTITSKTYMPILVPVQKKAVMLDCPGFLDTRSHFHEIATSVFIKNVMEHIKSVKILVVTSHHAVRKGVDRTAFLNLLNNLVGFVKSLQNYKSSIALIVNKVELQVNPATMKLVSDEEILRQIIAFLNEVRTELRISEKTSPRVELLNVLLSQDGGEYRKIGILRRPTKAGLLTDIEEMVEQKANLEDLLNKNLLYSTCDAADFSVSLSEGAKLCIYKTEEILRNDIHEHLTTICDAILGYFKKYDNAHWSDVFPLLGPKRLMIKQINKLITKIGDHNNEDFEVTQLFDWLNVEQYELASVEEELHSLFFDYDFLASVVDTSRNDHKKFFPQLAALRKELNMLVAKFKAKCCYCACCFRF
jgi:energy-coupling factor transporter ATP-binding protein EcfA2